MTFFSLQIANFCLQCSDTIGWASGNKIWPVTMSDDQQDASVVVCL